MKKLSKNKTFVEGIIALIISQFVIKCIGVLYKIYLTNKEGFGDTGNAIFSGAFQIYTIFLTVTSIGVPNAISKLISDKISTDDSKGAYKTLKVSLVIFGLIGFIGCLILYYNANFIANNFLQMPKAEISLMILAPSVFFVSIESVLKGYFNGRKDIDITAKSQIIEQLIKFILTILVIELTSKAYNNTITIVAGAALASTMATIFCSMYLYKILQINKREIWKESIISKHNKQERILKIIKKIFILSLPISISSLLSSMTKTIDAFTIVRLLKDIMGESEATIQFGILTGKIETIIALPFSFNIAIATSLIPSISGDFIRKKMDMINKKIEFAFLLTSLIGTFSTMIIYTFSNDILKILFPNACQGSEMLKIAVFSIPIIVLTQTITGIFQGIGKINDLVIAFFWGAVVKLIGNIILIPLFGIYGAIISTIFAQLIPLIICIVRLKRKITIKVNISRILIKPTIATIISYIIIKITYNIINIKYIYGCILSIIIGAFVYITVNIMEKTLEAEELRSVSIGEKIYKLLVKVGIYR